ncbi:MAG: stage II sporulation protein P [Clostridia bacterium]|nr:stage II sporulation protein P [Clostridia bacterium]
MLYGGTIRQNANTKFFIASIVSLIVLIAVTVYGFKILFLNNGNNRRYNSLLYAQVINNSMPVIEVTTFEEEALAENNITIQGEILKLLGININNPISILSREIPIVKAISNKDANMEATIADNTISPFNLSEGQITASASKRGIDSGNFSRGNSGKTVDVNDPALKEALAKSKPKVLIYHTHTTEAFSPNGNYNGDSNKNIVDIGQDLKTELEKNYGVSVIHDKTIHDSDFNNSYSKSRVTVEKYLKEYTDFDLIIDMHRDAVYSKSSVTMNMNGENVAKLMFVLTKKNPSFSKNQAVVDELTKISNDLFPGFCRGSYYYNYGNKYFNQDKSSNAILVEVGANINTHQEAKNSVKYTARIIAEYLNNQK